MNLVVPRAELVSLIAPHAPAPSAKGGRPPFAVRFHIRPRDVKNGLYCDKVTHRNLKPDFNALRINMGTSPAANSFATNENCVRTTPRSWLKVLNP